MTSESNRILDVIPIANDLEICSLLKGPVGESVQDVMAGNF